MHPGQRAHARRSGCPARLLRLALAALAVPAQAALERGEPHDRVERPVALEEVDARPAVAEVLETGEALGARPQRLADRVVLPRLVRLHLREPLPRLAHAARQQELRDRERAVADEP